MKLDVVERKKNPLLKREEFMLILHHDGKATPAVRDILPEVSKTLKIGKEMLTVEKIFTEKGKAASKAKVFAYSSRKDIPKEKLEKMERKMKKKSEAGISERAKEPEEKKAGKKPRSETEETES